MPSRSSSRVFAGLYAAMTVAALTGHAFASGLDTPSGVTNLPLNIEGVMGICLAQPGQTCPTPNGVGGINLGIGVETPQYPLDVNGVVRVQSQAYIGYVAGSSGGVLLAPTSTYGNPAVQALTEAGAAAALLINPSGGNVGIGTPTPQAALDVNGGVLATGTALDNGVAKAIEAGAGCAPEGMLGYDLTNHEPVYCSKSPSVWTSLAPPTLVLEKTTTVSDDTGEVDLGWYNLCTAVGTYQNGNNGYSEVEIDSAAGQNSSGQYYWLLYGTQPAQGAGAGSLITYIYCWDLQ